MNGEDTREPDRHVSGPLKYVPGLHVRWETRCISNKDEREKTMLNSFWPLTIPGVEHGHVPIVSRMRCSSVLNSTSLKATSEPLHRPFPRWSVCSLAHNNAHISTSGLKPHKNGHSKQQSVCSLKLLTCTKMN